MKYVCPGCPLWVDSVADRPHWHLHLSTFIVQSSGSHLPGLVNHMHPGTSLGTQTQRSGPRKVLFVLFSCLWLFLAGSQIFSISLDNPTFNNAQDICRSRGTVITAVEGIKVELNTTPSTYPLSCVYVGTAFCMSHAGMCVYLYVGERVSLCAFSWPAEIFFSRQNIINT